MKILPCRLKALLQQPLRLHQFLHRLPYPAFSDLGERAVLLLMIPHSLDRRQVGLELDMPHLKRGQALHLVVDSTGCKVYGEGEWKVRVHGTSKRRTCDLSLIMWRRYQ